jgi:F-type H+-transporting ATPase subunit gamma
MRMVSASKLLKSQEQKDQAKTYANKMFEMLQNIASSMNNNADPIPLLTGSGKNDVHLLVLVSSDKGLCGSFNTSIAKKAKNIAQQITAQGKDFKILCVGKKAFEQIKPLYGNKVVGIIPSFSNKKFNYEQAVELANQISEMFNKAEFDECSFIYAEFINALKQNVTTRKLIPLVNTTNSLHKEREVYEYEPNQDTILEKMLPVNLVIQIYYIILESIASEHGARMTSMDSATNNASEMIGKLTLLYNRTRQAVITKELIEIISSAEVV